MSSDTDVPGKELQPNLAFDILSSSRRRMILDYLRQNSSEATVNELTRELAAVENGVDAESLSREQRKRVYVSIHQSHLPRLEEADLIEYDDDSGKVRLTIRAAELYPYLTPTVEYSYPWEVHFLMLGVASLLLLGASLVGGPFVGAMPTIVVNALITAAFTVSALAYYADWRRQRWSPPGTSSGLR